MSGTLIRALAAGLALCAAAAALADYPAKPVRIILPYAAGGGGDQVTRALAQSLSETWKQPVVVDNRPGAGATIGTDAVTKAAPDGYTLLVTANTIAVSPAAYPKLPYDVLRDLAPITLMVQTPYVLTVSNKVPATKVEELLKLAKDKPGTLNYASPGNGTLSHLTYELMRARTGIQAATIVYKGSNPAMLDTVAGQVDFIFDTVAAVGQQVKAQKLRALAVTTAQRSGFLPDLPTMAESGIPNFDVSVWFGLMAPAGTPPEIIQKLNTDVVKALNHPALVAKLSAVGMEVRTSSAAEFGELLRRDVARWGEVVKQANIKFE